MTVVIIEEYHCYQIHTHKIATNILPSRETPRVDEIIKDHQCEFQRKRSTTGHICCIL
jgi:hypothetical protein